MFQELLLILISVLSVASGCSVTHEQVWQCIVGEKCLDSLSLHRHTHKSSSLKRPYILAVEGRHYHRLFSDCDSNNDGCIDLQDVLSSATCKRSCIWMETMHKLTC